VHAQELQKRCYAVGKARRVGHAQHCAEPLGDVQVVGLVGESRRLLQPQRDARARRLGRRSASHRQQPAVQKLQGVAVRRGLARVHQDACLCGGEAHVASGGDASTWRGNHEHRVVRAVGGDDLLDDRRRAKLPAGTIAPGWAADGANHIGLGPGLVIEPRLLPALRAFAANAEVGVGGDRLREPAELQEERAGAGRGVLSPYGQHVLPRLQKWSHLEAVHDLPCLACAHGLAVEEGLECVVGGQCQRGRRRDLLDLEVAPEVARCLRSPVRRSLAIDADPQWHVRLGGEQLRGEKQDRDHRRPPGCDVMPDSRFRRALKPSSRSRCRTGSAGVSPVMPLAVRERGPGPLAPAGSGAEPQGVKP